MIPSATWTPTRPDRAEPTFSEQAYLRLRADIISGATAPGEKLKIEVLQQRYQLSNTPLREALNRLAGEKLVVADERRGFRAAPVSEEDFNDLTDYRLVLEHGALVAAIEHGTDEWEGAVLSAFHQLENSTSRLDAEGEQSEMAALKTSEWRDRHKAFHMALISGCRSKRLMAVCSDVFDQAERYRNLASKTDTNTRHSGQEHRQIVDAVLERDAPLATALMRNHVRKSTIHILAMLREQMTAAVKPPRATRRNA